MHAVVATLLAFSLVALVPAPAQAVMEVAIDTSGNVQPAIDDPVIANKHTYWESNGQVTRRILIA